MAKTWATKCCSGTYKNNYQLCCGIKEYKNDALSTTSDLVFIGDGTNGRDAGNLGLVEGKSLENGVAYRFTVDVTAGVSSAVLTVEKVER